MFKGIIASLLLILFFVAANVQGQEITPHGQFLSDSIKIGVPVGFSLAVKYPRGIDIIFPDSLYDFGPFELAHKQYFPTHSDTTHSYDSAVYYVTSFEVDSVQTFTLPVFVLHGNDSTPIYSTPDTVLLQQMVAEIPDSLSIEAIPLKENTTYKRVSFEFNYPYFILGLLLFLILCILVIVFFGATIKRYFLLRRMLRSYKKFMERYDMLVLATDRSAKEQAERVLVLWKQYLEKLEGKPYTQLTTKEIINYYKPENVGNTLKSLDQAIYGKPENTLTDEYASLRRYAQEKYESKIEEVKHG